MPRRTVARRQDSGPRHHFPRQGQRKAYGPGLITEALTGVPHERNKFLYNGSAAAFLAGGRRETIRTARSLFCREALLTCLSSLSTDGAAEIAWADVPALDSKI
jgi:hypothetical protein